MKIRSLYVNNFRTLVNTSVNFNSYYCAISGKNNAGKSSLIRVLGFLFEEDHGRPFSPTDEPIIFSKDKTQWLEEASIRIVCDVQIDNENDSEIYFFIEKFSPAALSDPLIELKILVDVSGSNDLNVPCTVNGVDVDTQSSSEILKNLRASNNFIVHNSKKPRRNIYYSSRGVVELLDLHFSEADQVKINLAEKSLQSKIRSASNKHREELTALLGRLKENFDVQFNTQLAFSSSSFPVAMSLTDKQVEVPLQDWGSGTQNRTHTLMSILQAARIKSSTDVKNRTTPVVIIEEPEAFLHPSGQAEFGRVLEALAEELKIQIICTTHSPFMLNQRTPSANILLERKFNRGKAKESFIVDTSGDNWMAPFAENLGIIPPEFESWKAVIGAQNNRVILVEGEIECEYFQFFRDSHPDIYTIPQDVEVRGYGGKDALRNTLLLKFITDKFERVFITFDLDADGEIKPILEKIGLVDQNDFCSIGDNRDGAKCIEGLLPETILSEVYAKEIALVQALQSADPKVRKSNANALKRKLLERLKGAPLKSSDLKGFAGVFKKVGKAFEKPK